MKESFKFQPIKIEKSDLQKELKKSFSNLFDKNDEENNLSNSGSLGDIDDVHIDYNKLNSLKLYTDRNLRYFTNHMTEAEIAVEEIIISIKKEATFLLLENHILSKLPTHSSVLCLEMIDLLVNMVENENCVHPTEKIKACIYSEDEEIV